MCKCAFCTYFYIYYICNKAWFGSNLELQLSPPSHDSPPHQKNAGVWFKTNMKHH